jgi:hypothetical protein
MSSSIMLITKLLTFIFLFLYVLFTMAWWCWSSTMDSKWETSSIASHIGWSPRKKYFPNFLECESARSLVPFLLVIRILACPLPWSTYCVSFGSLYFPWPTTCVSWSFSYWSVAYVFDSLSPSSTACVFSGSSSWHAAWYFILSVPSSYTWVSCFGYIFFLFFS